MGILKRIFMGLPSTKEGCDLKIAEKQAEIASLRAKIPAYNSKDMKNAARRRVATLRGDIARLRAHRRSLK